MVKVTLFRRDGCELCDRVVEDLGSLEEQIPHRLIKIDIDSDPVLKEKYKEIIPVVEIGPYTMKAPITLQDLQISLAAARDGQVTTKSKGTARNRKFAVRLNRLVLSFTRHWLAFINLFLFLYVGLPVAAPILMNAGAAGPATAIYKVYSPMCHQLAYRSWFLYGDQSAYPVQAANVSGETYEEITGLNPDDLKAARDFIGNDQVGYKIALCERDVAIWGGMVIFGLLFALGRKNIKPVPIIAWLLIGVVPIALDGGSQLISSFSLFSFISRESTPLLRTLTGVLFGVVTEKLARADDELNVMQANTLP
jgi:uncharacterized membrane protein